jgi:cyclic pyranopterin phosphate synthase
MIDYLRISVTDRCNLRCIYCHPLGGKKFLAHSEILRYEEIADIVSILSSKGIKRVRLTGGEPLVRIGVESLIRMLKQLNSLSEIALTTNGVALAEAAKILKEAGLTRVNISLNTLKRKRYANLTGKDVFESVWSSIFEALSVGLKPVKVNTILFKGINEDEIVDFAELTLKYDVSVRFIEYFPTTKGSLPLEQKRISGTQAKNLIEKRFGRLSPANDIVGAGPAVYYRMRDGKGQIGFISPISENFCQSCNRLRLSAEGKLYPCLFSPSNIDIKEILRSGKRGELEETLDRLMLLKKVVPEGQHEFIMSDIGG